jgi:hypothetical protein
MTIEIEKGEFCAKTVPAQKVMTASANVARPYLKEKPMGTDAMDRRG